MAPSLQRADAVPPPPVDTGVAGLAGRQTPAAGGSDARNRRTLGDIGNLVTAPGVHFHGKARPGEGINRRPISRISRAHPSKNVGASATAASENAVAPRPSEPSAASKPARKAPVSRPQHANRVDRTGSDENKKLSKGAGIAGVTRTTTGDDVKSLTRRLAVAESQLAQEKDKVRMGLESIRKRDLLIDDMKEKQRTDQEELIRTNLIINARNTWVEEVIKKYGRLYALNCRLENDVVQKDAELQQVKAQKEAELQQVKVQKEAEIQKVKAQKKAEVQKLMEENVRLNSKVDKKEALLQAMSEQLKFMALNHLN